MFTSHQLPVQHRQAEAEPRGPKPLRRAGYYARRVRETFTARVAKVVCSIFLSVLFVLGLVAFILWLSLRPHRPRFHIQSFSVPGLGQPNGFENTEISFNVTARNSNQRIGFFYGTVEGSVFYRDQQIGSTPLLSPFYQEPKNTTIIYKVLSGATLTVNSQRWMEFINDRNQGMIVFRLGITSTIRFKVFAWWDSKRHRMHANCDVTVGPDGLILASNVDKRCPVYFT